MNNLDRIFKNSATIKEYSTSYLDYLHEVMNAVSLVEIAEFVNTLDEARKRGSIIYFMGNGGSAATASHYSNDFSIGIQGLKKPFKTMSLNDNQAVMTAIGNDYGYEFIFSKQLDSILHENDVVVVISASGNSKNLIKAIETANEKKAKTVAILAFDGGIIKGIVDQFIHVKTETGEYGPAEDAHMIIDHLVSSYLYRKLGYNVNN